MAQLNPYLNFPGNCRLAMEFYHGIFGGELFVQTIGEMPEMASKMPPDMKSKILHSMLNSGGIVIMASDLNRSRPVEGNTIQLCINCESEAQLHDFFDKLSAGGKVIEKPAPMPWGGIYAELTDRYGKQWVFNYQVSD